MERLGQRSQLDRPFAALSGGEMRMVGLAQALMGAPRLLILDEFTRGLATEDRQRVMKCLALLPRDRLVLFSTHQCEDVEALDARLLLLWDGALAYDGRSAGLRRSAAGHVRRLPYAAALPPGALVSRSDPAGRWKRVVSCWPLTGGEELPPLGGEDLSPAGGEDLPPTLEDACLWFWMDRSARKERDRP
jgi:ABC-2 type transport system ATP-binding protein